MSSCISPRIKPFNRFWGASTIFVESGTFLNPILFYLSQSVIWEISNLFACILSCKANLEWNLQRCVCAPTRRFLRDCRDGSEFKKLLSFAKEPQVHPQYPGSSQFCVIPFPVDLVPPLGPWWSLHAHGEDEDRQVCTSTQGLFKKGKMLEAGNLDPGLRVHVTLPEDWGYNSEPQNHYFRELVWCHLYML